jgi:uncharacterized protein (TIGR02246 family)
MSAPHDPKQIARDGVAHSNRRFADAATRGDASAMAAAYTEDAVFLPLDAETLEGRAAIERFWHGGIKMGIRGIEVETLQLEHAGVLAYEIGRCTLYFEPEAEAPVTDVATNVVVHRRQQDGSWRRAVEIFNRHEPLPPAKGGNPDGNRLAPALRPRRLAGPQHEPLH